MLVARICQLYPNEVAGAIVTRFFLIMYQWNWPQPVLLKQIEEGPLQVRVWNPKLYPQDRSHRMPIITPAYPSMCSTHNVTQSTQMIMTQEFKRGAELVDRIIIGKADWAELFQPHDFFHRYKYYLQVVASSGSADLQLKWSGTVESRVRQLIMKLELVPTLMCAHPFIKGFDQVSLCYNDDEVRMVATGHVPEEVAKRTKQEDLPKEGFGAEDAREKDEEAKKVAQEGHRMIWTTTFYIGLCIEPKSATTANDVPGASRKLDISFPTNQFTQMVKQWEQYDESSMGISVSHIKWSNLPAYTMGNDPRPPKQASKRPKKVSLLSRRYANVKLLIVSPCIRIKQTVQIQRTVLMAVQPRKESAYVCRRWCSALDSRSYPSFRSSRGESTEPVPLASTGNIQGEAPALPIQPGTGGAAELERIKEATGAVPEATTFAAAPSQA